MMLALPSTPLRRLPQRTHAKGKKSDVEVDMSPLPLAVLKELLGKDKEHVNLTVTRRFHQKFCLRYSRRETNQRQETGRRQCRRIKGGYLHHEQYLLMSLFVQWKSKNNFEPLSLKYFASVKSHIIRSHKV